MVAIDEMLETPLVDGPKLAERVAAKDKDLLVVFYAPWSQRKFAKFSNCLANFWSSARECILWISARTFE